MKGNKNKIITAIAVIFIIAVVTVLYTIQVKKVDNISQTLSPQDLKSMTYNEVTDQSVKQEDGTTCEFVEFSSFFTQDLNKDGQAEKVDGTCRDISDSAQIYFRFSVLSKGYLKNGKIEINGENFRLDTAIVADSVIAENYIDYDTKQINFVEKVQNGTQKLIEAKIKPRINNINDYSNNKNAVVFTGTYVYEDGDGNEVEVPVSKTCNLTVDWYGSLSSRIVTKDVLRYSNKNIVNKTTGNIDLNFTIKTEEYKYNRLLLDSNIVTIKIPTIKGISAVNATVAGNNVESNYNKETQELIITRKSTVDENGNITQSLPISNEYQITMSYPKEIYNESAEESIVITVPVQSYYTGYNNPGEEFKNEIATNIAKSNVAEKSLAITYENPIGDVYEFDVGIGEYVTYPYDRYVVSKKETMKMYNNIESNEKDKYDVRWIFRRGPSGTITKTEMKYTKADELNNNNSLEDCTKNIGIYIEGAKAMLGENGYIKVYDADKSGEEAILYTFTASNWDTYTKENPFYYENSVKNIRIETSKSAQNSTLIIHNIKEIDNEKLVSKYTKEEFDKLNLIYTNLTGTIYSEGSPDPQSQDRTEVAYFEDEESRATIYVSKEKISTVETTQNEIITITTVSNNYNESKWQNGEFLIEMPQDVTLMEINSVTINNNNVKIKGYNLFEDSGKYFIKIITENDTPTTYSITINCNITPNSRIATTTKEIKLYAYNQYYENYKYKTKDIYDANNNGNVEEYVGTYTDEIQFIAPTGLITYQTVTDYNDEQEDEITISPKIAEVKKEQRTAQINVETINNYSSTISGTKILGKIPFEGNKYILTEGDLGSQFTTALTAKVALDTAKNYTNNFSEERLSELNKNIKIYYSANENPTNNLQEQSNGWIEESNVTNWAEIKTYLIDFGNFVMNKGDVISFKYQIQIPEGIDYEKVSYCGHAVYFNLDTPDGKLADYTEPNKLGIKITRKYNLVIQKSELGKETKVQNALYLLESGNQNDTNYKSYIELTDSNGNINLNDLYVGKKYKLTELKCTDDYEISTGMLEFEVTENEQTGELEVQIITEGAGYKASNVSENTVNIQLEDRIRYDIALTKFRTGTDTKVSNAVYLITSGTTGEEGYEAYRRTTNEEGIIDINNLYLDKIYSIEEISTTDNFAIAEGKLKFRATQSEENGNISIEIIEQGAGYKTHTINQDSEKINLEVEDEVRYKLILNKKDATTNQNLAGVKYQIKGEGVDETILTNEQGNIEVSKLRLGKRYTVTELSAKSYYINEPFEICITKNSEGNLETNVGTITDNKTDVEVNISVTDEKIPTYDLDLIKVERGNKEKKLSGATFVIKGKDLEKELTTDENGLISIQGLYQYVEGKEVDGIYTIEEKIPAQGYVLSSEILKIQVSKIEGKLQVNALEGASLIADGDSGKDIISDTNKVTITLQNTPIFKIKKVDGSTHEAIANTKLAIYKINYNEDGTQQSIEEAKNPNGDIIGEEETINNKTYHIIKTNEQGEVTADLSPGFYCIQEIEAAEGYALPENEEDRMHYFGIGESKEERIDFITTETKELDTFNSHYNDIEEVEDGYIIVGESQDEFNIELADGTTKTLNGGYIIKYDITGQKVLWCDSQDGITNLRDVIVTPEGESIAIGFFYGPAVLKYDKNGTLIFQKIFLDLLGKEIDFSSWSVKEKIVKTENGYRIFGSLDLADETTVTTINTVNQGEKVLSSGNYITEYNNDGELLSYYNSKDEGFEQEYKEYEKGLIQKDYYTKTQYNNEITNITTENQGAIQVQYSTVISLDENGNYKWAYSINNEKIHLYDSIKTSNGEVVTEGIVEEDLSINLDGQQYELKAGGILIKFNQYGAIQDIENGFPAEYYQEFIQDKQGRHIGVGYHKGEDYYAGIMQILELKRINPEFQDLKEITIENTMKQYKITTEVRQGKGSISGEGSTPYESVIYKQDSTLPIIATPESGWEIKKITINDKIVEYTVAEDGSVTLPQFTEMTEDKHIVVWFANPNEDYNFELTKTNEDGTPLANAKFTIKKIVKDADGNETLYDAKDVDGNLVGYEDVIDGKSYRVVESDANGLIRLNLQFGNYKVTEIEAPYGYGIADNEGQIFSVTTIEYIEDLVDLSNEVNNGEMYSGKNITLMNTLDFEEESSYRNKNDTSYGDLNGDGTVEGIQAELTDKEDGVGFTPIGNSSHYFSGIFDGQGNEIRNIYINISSDSSVYAGLFGCINNGEINNLGIKGNIRVSSTTSGYTFTGGIVGYVKGNSSISNCYNTGDISSRSNGSNSAGGIVGEGWSDISISNCYNSGNISSNNLKYYENLAGGIAGAVWNNSSITNCYNVGNVEGICVNNYQAYTGGIVGFLKQNNNISNCYNLGKVNNTRMAGGIVGSIGGHSIKGNNNIIDKCYNSGYVNSGNNNGNSARWSSWWYSW